MGRTFPQQHHKNKRDPATLCPPAATSCSSILTAATRNTGIGPFQNISGMQQGGGDLGHVVSVAAKAF
jgi:hypothetical protein